VDNIYVIISVSERTTSMDFPGGDWAIISIDGASLVENGESR
jgi:hypothetical protein